MEIELVSREGANSLTFSGQKRWPVHVWFAFPGPGKFSCRKTGSIGKHHLVWEGLSNLK